MVKSDWLAKFNYEDYFVKRIGLEGLIREGQLTCKCPFHSDGSPSLSVSLSSPGFWKCHAGCGGGNIIQFHARKSSLRMIEAEEELRLICGDIKSVPQDEVVMHHQTLLRTAAVMEFLRVERGYTDKTIAEFRLGFDGDRIWIPVYFKEWCVNVRKYDWTKTTNAKYLPYASGYATARLFPHANLEQDTLYVFEGETDCILANQLGIRAITGTGGAGTWKDSFTPWFEGRDAVICYDVDSAGKEGSLDAALRILGVAKSVKIVHLPLRDPGKGNKDFTDWILKGQHGLEDFLQLVAQTPPFQVAKPVERPPDLTVRDVTLSRSSDSVYLNKRVHVKVTTAGKDLTPWYAPTKMALSCPVNQGARCKRCTLKQGTLQVTIPPESQDILKLINRTENEQKQAIRRIAGVAEGCPAWKFDVDESINVEELRVIPEVTFSDEGNQYVSRTIYSVINENIQTNRAYEMTGTALPHPDSQYATIVIGKAEQAQASWDKFKMGPEVAERLKIMQPEGEGLKAVEKKLQMMAHDLTVNITRRRKREDLILATLLCYASVRRFNFAGELVHKGLVEVCIIGDTRTGKSTTVKKLVDFLRLGEFGTGENTTRAGLIGGLSQVADRWHLTWGKIPLNNGGLLVIDEAHVLSLEDLDRLSGIRSEGVAELKMVHQEKTEAMTRLLWIANPRSTRKLETYTYGVKAVLELFGKPEEVARLDLALATVQSEVSAEEINSLEWETVEHLHTAEAMRDLILWAWSRKPEQVVFAPGTEQTVMFGASKLGDIYNSSVSLVEPSEIRIKIAKLAVAVAALCFSTENGEQLIVKDEHVHWAAGFIDQCYSKPSMGYRLFSDTARRSREMSKERQAEVSEEFKRYRGWKDLVDAFMEQEVFFRRDMLESVGYSKEEGTEFWAWLRHRHLIAPRSSSGFVKTPVFKDILVGLLEDLRDNPIQEEALNAPKTDEF